MLLVKELTNYKYQYNVTCQSVKKLQVSI